MIFISTVFENVYMVKLVRVPGSNSTSRPGRVQGRDNNILFFSFLRVLSYSLISLMNLFERRVRDEFVTSNPLMGSLDGEISIYSCDNLNSFYHLILNLFITNYSTSTKIFPNLIPY